MQRYTVAYIQPDGQTTRLIVPFNSLRTVGALASEVQTRLSRRGISVTSDQLLPFRLDGTDGPILDENDSLESVILLSDYEILFASTHNASTTEDGANQRKDASFMLQKLPDGVESFTVRVITPALARRYRIEEILPLRHQFLVSATLRQIKSSVAEHLGYKPEDIIAEDGEVCNCKFARLIAKGNTFQRPNSAEQIEPHSNTPVLVVHSQNEVDVVSVSNDDDNTVIEGVKTELEQRLNVSLGKKHIALHRGMRSFGASAQTMTYGMLPVVSICSKSRHPDHEDDASAEKEPEQTILDLHVAEASIATANLDATVEDLSLQDFLVNGILNLYVITRKGRASESDSESDRESDWMVGMQGIFLSDDCWKPPKDQSERGMAIFLSSLRVFSHIASSLEPKHYNMLIHLLHSLTRFPPVVRAFDILKRSATPAPSDCAVITQTMFEALVDVVPYAIIKSDHGRVFEGARSLFGLLLDKCKTCSMDENGPHLPYQTSLKTIQATDEVTSEPILYPVNTNLGLLERGCFNALRQGLIKLDPDTEFSELTELALDNRTKRGILLGGGLQPEITVLDMDVLNSSISSAAEHDIYRFITRRELANLNQMNISCGRNRLGVTSPSALKSTQAHTLTLDRDGLCAVYLGRQPCSPDPATDFVLFRPTKRGDCTVDPAIIMQLVGSILTQRESDGSAIFDAPGDPNLRSTDPPEELLMICVDSSASMGDSVDFDDIDEERDDSAATQDNVARLLKELCPDDPSVIPASLNLVKDHILNHASFEDIVGSVVNSPHHRKRGAAKFLVGAVIEEVANELQDLMTQIENISGRATWGFRWNYKDLEDRAAHLKALLLGLNIHKDGMEDLILFYARYYHDRVNTNWIWNPCDSVPSNNSGSDSLPSHDFEVPHDYCCPITREIIDQPVTASDGRTYERSAILAWFRVRASSPMTGLSIDTRISADGQLEYEIKRWVRGDGIALIASPEEPPPKTRPSMAGEPANAITISFVCRLGTFDRLVLPELSTHTLYELAFRGMGGKHDKFALFMNTTQIQENGNTIEQVGIKDGTTIQIRIPDNRIQSPFHRKPDGDGEMCLVKVYVADNRHPKFAFWSPKKTEATLSSIVFKYWRSVSRVGLSVLHVNFSEWKVWADLNYKGDGQLSGTPGQMWEKLDTYFTPQHAFGSLQNEPLWDERAQGATPSLSPLVLKVMLSGGGSSRRKGISRLDVLKQMFDQFVNRILAYEYRTHLGLITFNATAELKQPLTNIVENFRSTVNSLHSGGDTALWDAIALGSDQLEEYGKKFLNAKKRILCISDGVDNKSDRRVANLCNSLVQKEIIIDSFCLGKEVNRDLRLLCYWTGGYKFHPQSLGQAMAICELEPVLNQLERPPREIPSSSRAFLHGSNFFFPPNEQVAKPETVTEDIYPKRKEHPNLHDSFIELATFNALREGPNAIRGPRSSRTTRLMSEMKHLLANPHPHYDVYICESDMSFWKVIMQGPPDSIYADGTFLLYLHMEESYPTLGPKGRFVTPIYHPNINRHGRICHSIFDRNWTSDTRCRDVINTVYSLLLVPEFSDPVNVVVTLSYHYDTVDFAETAKKLIRKHATKSREAWRRDILRQ